MKIAILFPIALVATSAIFLPTTNACEKTCQVGISDAFAKHYDGETSELWNNLTNNLIDTIYTNTNVSSYIPTKQDDAVIKSKLQTNIKNRVTFVQTTFNSGLSETIRRAIFVQKKNGPQAFRGDCNHPFRVKQPKPPKIWAREDCEKMDYVCGNPPSICHFLDVVKQRNYDAVNDALNNTATNGTLSKTLLDGVTMTLKRTGIFSVSGLDELLSLAKPYIDAKLKEFTVTFKGEFCTNEKCDVYDEEIKTQLLTYP